MLAPDEAQAQFALLAKENTGDVDLLEGALLIAAALGSQVDVDDCHARIDRLAARVSAVHFDASQSAPGEDPRGLIAALNRVLFVEAGFRGNEENYYDPENSFLNMVLERRTGLPITLSVVYMEVARRAGLELRGVGLPGHFVVGYFEDAQATTPTLVVDPFNGGQFLSLRECEAIVHGMSLGSEETSRWMRPVPPRQVLSRILSNLKQVYSSQEMTKQHTTTLGLMLALDPEAGKELRERAFLSYRAGKFGQAYADIKQCLDMAPRGADRDQLNYYRRLFERLSVSHN